ncbi:peptidase inhibitor family I36 protein [Streptomyces badius]
MSLRRRAAGIAAVLAAACTVLGSSVPAQAVGGCASGRLCLWQYADFKNSGEHVTTASTNKCIDLVPYYFPSSGGVIHSYVNNLPVNASLWQNYNSSGWVKIKNLPSGGFSSNTGGDTAGAVCMGSNVPPVSWR